MSIKTSSCGEVALLTKHHKEMTIGPLLQAELGLSLQHTDAFDTDTLGTFDGKQARTLSAKQTALKKALLACDITGLSKGLGSEGSFNSEFGLGIIDQEILAYVDIKQNIEIFAVFTKPIGLNPFTAKDEAQLHEFWSAYQADQGWHIMQNNTETSLPAKSGLMGYDALLDAANEEGFPVHVSPDFRAMNCPQRRDVIAQATMNLIERLQGFCPQCEMPNFVYDKPLRGLACELCEMPTSVIKAEVAHCEHCDYEHIQPVKESKASAFYCASCNP